MIEAQQVQLRGIALHRNEEVSFGRLLNNEKLDEAGLIESYTRRTAEACTGKHVLSIQDTSELHYSNHSGRIKDYKGLGDVGRCQLGYFLHPSLAIDAQTQMILGLSDVHIWNRDRSRNYDTGSRKQRRIEQKESYKWISSSLKSQSCLQKAEHITIIQDRDGDIFEEFLTIPDSRTDLLIRSKTDRRLYKKQQSLYELVGSQSSCIVYELQVRADNKKRQQRKALMEVRYVQTKIQCPENLRASVPVEFVELTIVHCRELAQTVPAGEAPIDWKILTTHEVEDFMQAVQIIFWYSLRWLIEDFFRLLKKKGFNLESSQLETGAGLRKLGLFTMQAATKVMQLRQARDGNDPTPISTVFDPTEQQCLKSLLPVLEGKTEKLKNPHADHLLAWATWIIARLGGWSGYVTQRPAGLITLKNGLQKFNLIYTGWKINNNNIDST